MLIYPVNYVRKRKTSWKMFLTRVSALVGQLLPLIGKKKTISQVDSTGRYYIILHSVIKEVLRPTLCKLYISVGTDV